MSRLRTNVEGILALLLFTGLLAVTACVTCEADCPRLPFGHIP